MPRKDWKRIGDILIEKKLLTPEELTVALKEQKKSGESLGHILGELNFISEKQLMKTLAEQMELPTISLDHYAIDPKAMGLVPEELARRFSLIPLFKLDDTLMVAIADPLDIYALDEVQRKSGYLIDPIVATEADIQRAIDRYYRVTDSIKKVVKDLGKGEERREAGSLEGLEIGIGGASVVRLVNLIITQAVRDRASDIHLEPDGKGLRVRYRIDGVLQETSAIPENLQAAVVSRIKVLSGMDIAKKYLPQDGHLETRIGMEEVDFRVATYPTIFGEKIVLRILYKLGMLLGLEELGFLKEDLTRFTEIIEQPHGLILTTGPTGSGKTTTLYASLNKINTLKQNIITIEDPVEYELPNVNQAQINPKAGLTFANGLRSILRQDPDVIMVGEIRDLETAQIAIQSALTGHLIFSCLHTNDAVGTATRLIDMGGAPFVVSASLLCAIGQRLVRKICPHCKERYLPRKEELNRIEFSEKDSSFFRGKGCPHCNQTGYYGRTGVFQFFIPNEEIKELILSKSPVNLIKGKALKTGMRTLRDVGLEKVRKGITTISEVLRVTQDEEIQ